MFDEDDDGDDDAIVFIYEHFLNCTCVQLSVMFPFFYVVVCG